jgi:cleavage and polyadenylation specificity factor subunit 2
MFVVLYRTSSGTLARQLIESGREVALNLEIRRRVRLEGAELEEYQRKERENKEKSQEKK